MQSTSGLGHTEGPVDGSLYARVRKKGSTDSGTATSNGFSPPGCQAEGLESTTPNPVVHSVSNEQGNLEQAYNCSMSFDSGHSTTSAQTDSLMPSRAMHLVPAQVHANGTCPPRETAILNDEEEEEDRKLGIGMKDESESEKGVPIPAVPIWSEPFQPSGCSDVRTGPFQEKSCETGSTFGLESEISSKVEMQAGKMSPQLAASVSTDPHLVSRISSNSTLRNDRTHSPFGVNNARTVNGIVNLSIPENVMASSPKYPSDWQRLDRAPQESNQDTPQQAEFGPVCGPIESQIAGVRTAAVPSIPARTASSRQAVQRTLSGLNGRSRPLARRQQSDTTFDRERPALCNYDLEEAMLPRLRAEEDFERSLQELNRLILELNHKVVPFGSPGSRPNCSIIHEQHQQLHSPVENNSVVPIDLAQPFVQHLSPQSTTNCVSPKTFSPHTPCLDLNMDLSPSDRRYYYLNGGRATQNENVLPNQVTTCLNPVEESIVYSSPTSLVHVRENRTPLSSRPIGLLGSDMFPMNSASVVPVSHSNSHKQEGGAALVCNNSTIQSSDTGKQGLRRTDHEDIARLHDVEQRSPMESSSPAQDVTNGENVSPTNSLLYGTSSTPAFPVCPPTPYINQGRFTPSPLRGATLSALHLHSPPRTAYSRDIAPVPEAWTPNGTYPCHSEGLSDPSACGQSSPSQGSPTERVSGLDHIQLSASPSLPSHTYRLPTHQWTGQDSSHIPSAFHAEPHEQSSYGFLNGTPRWASSTTVEALGRASHTASTSSADIYRHPSLTSLPNESTMESRARVKFVQDTTKYWYKKDISRDQAVTLLKDKEPGAFVIRDSHSYRGAYGLAVKVSEPPPGLEQPRKDGMLGELGSELVRHYLIESTSKGVRLKGCINEPTFGSLSALVYQHSITPLALPCRLVIPCQDPTEGVDVDSAENHTSEILKQGAACNVLYLGTVELESLTGPEALGRAIRLTLENPPSEPTVVHFKAAAQGITLTDHQRKVFFRRYYKASSITFCDVDPQLRKWPIDEGNCASIFGFVARKQGSHGDNQCHVFAELERDQPAAAITGFVCKALLNAEPIS
uniref:SH2 domain-containing protein n=1 Tax=Eptatretus burgeri TaxID=7764 RepID=A0A8C4WVF9_EPTBU